MVGFGIGTQALRLGQGGAVPRSRAASPQGGVSVPDFDTEAADLVRQIEADFGPENLRTEVWLARNSRGEVDLDAGAAVRVTHIPSGQSAESRQFGSQVQNKLAALQELRTLLAAS